MVDPFIQYVCAALKTSLFRLLSLYQMYFHSVTLIGVLFMFLLVGFVILLDSVLGNMNLGSMKSQFFSQSLELFNIEWRKVISL